MPKKISFGITALTFFSLVTNTFAQVPVQVNVPRVGINPLTTVGTLLSNILSVVFIVAALAVLFMLIWGAFSWITSGGDKDAVGAARKRIVNALIGLAVLAIAFLITRVVGQVLNIDILNLKFLPTLDACAPTAAGQAQVFDPTTGGCRPAVNIPIPTNSIP